MKKQISILPLSVPVNDLVLFALEDTLMQKKELFREMGAARIKGSDIGSVNGWFFKGAQAQECVDSNTAALHILRRGKSPTGLLLLAARLFTAHH